MRYDYQSTNTREYRSPLGSGFVLVAFITILALLSVLPNYAHGACTDPPGDITADGSTDVLDVMCNIKLTFWELDEKQGPLPACIADPSVNYDTNCDGSHSVVDTVISINQALGLPMGESVDENGDGCPDACALDVLPPSNTCENDALCTDTFSQLDANGDNSIDSSEWEALGGPAELYALLDKNQDGSLVQDEVATAFNSANYCGLSEEEYANAGLSTEFTNEYLNANGGVGFWDCTWLFADATFASSMCIVSVPMVPTQCSLVCTGPILGYGCISCLDIAAGGSSTVCNAARNAWDIVINAGCLGWKDDESCAYEVIGCTDPMATNYDPSATEDDGTCYAQEGCMDWSASNYNPSATEDDGSCAYEVIGCTDPMATNYDPYAMEDDGNCMYAQVGCMDSSASNYDPYAMEDDGNCMYAEVGCMDWNASNYDPYATEDDGSCMYAQVGCMDWNASNYDPSATEDDGTCYAQEGCIDWNASNYDPYAMEDDGSCMYAQMGCMDWSASNYDPYATEDDASCSYAGCSDLLAMNFNPDAMEDDGSCIYDDECYSDMDCGPGLTCMMSYCEIDDTQGTGSCDDDPLCSDFLFANDDNNDGVLDEEEWTDFYGSSVGYDVLDTDGDGTITGDELVENISSANYTAPDGETYACADGVECAVATAKGPLKPCPGFIKVSACTLCAGCIVIAESIPPCWAACATCGYCLGIDAGKLANGMAAVGGCTDILATNFDPWATEDDESCAYEVIGCTDGLATNYDPYATEDDETCMYAQVGCMDSSASNYDPSATEDDGTCYSQEGCMDWNASNYDPSAMEDDGSCAYEVIGCTDPMATNYDPSATEDDGTCYAQEGCMDSNATNYDPSATEDDGSCAYEVIGCTDPMATNYDPYATADDGTCYAQEGCMDSSATNYDPSATEDDGSCIYDDQCYSDMDCGTDMICEAGSCLDDGGYGNDGYGGDESGDGSGENQSGYEENYGDDYL